MNQYSEYSSELNELMSSTAWDTQADWRLLRRLQIPNKFNDSNGGRIKRALVIDVETTGLSSENDEVIQLAMLPFDYEVATGRILTVHKDQAFEELREPSVPISETAALITGITNDAVGGMHIEADAVAQIAANADLVIAHNASFDRAMVEKHWPCFAEKPWACTLQSINWLHEGFSAGKLDYLGMQFGWFYDGHRALSDCEACLALLAQILPKSNQSVMLRVREAALREDYLIRAVKAPYDLRDKLKDRGYRWRPGDLRHGKVWWTTAVDPEIEVAWLRAEIYGWDSPVPVHPVSACDRYSERLWDFDK